MAVLALSSTELIFAAAGREHGWDMVIIIQHLIPLQEAGEGTLFHGGRVPYGQENVEEGAIRYHLLSGIFIRVNNFFSYTFC